MKKNYLTITLMSLFLLAFNAKILAQVVANDDLFLTTTALSGVVGNVLNNDTLGGTLIINPSDVVITFDNTNPYSFTVDATGNVNIAGVIPSGVYTITYVICDALNPLECDVSTVTIAINPALDAVNDFYTLNEGDGGSLSSILMNDTSEGIPVLPTNVTITLLSAPPSGFTVNTSTGEILVAATVTGGTYYITYQICNSAATVCDSAIVEITVVPLPVFCWKDIAAGGEFTTAISSDGSLWAWGDNTFLQLGNGTTVSETVPIKIGTDTNWLKVSSGRFDTLALKTDGTLWSWGANFNGEGGNGTNVGIAVPTQIGTDNDWKTISAGAFNVLAIKNDGTLWSWGANNWGQVGDGTTIERLVPMQIGVDNDWKSVASGQGHSLALKNDNSLWSWGYNVLGQLGDGTNTNKSTPNPIALGSAWKTISTSNLFCLAIKSDGTLWGWGQNSLGEIGDGTNIDKNTPTQIGTSTHWKSIAAGGFHSIAKKSDGTVWTWGYNIYGQLGNGNNTNTNVPLPLGSSTDWGMISAGQDHTISIKTDGLWTYGYNYAGQLGNATNTDQNVPILIGCAALFTPEYDKSSWSVYPNPTHGILSIKASAAVKKIEIYDFNGRMIFSSTENTTNVSLNIERFSAGIYLLKVISETGTSIQKIIKK